LLLTNKCYLNQTSTSIYESDKKTTLYCYPVSLKSVVIPDKIFWKDFKQALPGPLGRRAGARSNACVGDVFD